MKKGLLILFLNVFVGCNSIQEYKRADVQSGLPETFLEEGVEWKRAQPNANYDRGEWWKIYNDPALNELMDKLNNNNQTIANAFETYKSSQALVWQARSSYFPQLTATQNYTRQREASATEAGKYTHVNGQSLTLTPTWEIDLFNKTGFSVDADKALAESDKDNWIYTRLAQQTSLAQYYFEIAALDVDQKLLDDIVRANFAGLKYAENQMKSGITDELTLITYKNNYHTALQNAENNRINREQYQHAIAVLIGEQPSNFVIKPMYNVKFAPVYIPLMLPSQLIERRPDVAQAENLVKQANAQLGLAKVAYFPTFSYVGSIEWSRTKKYGPIFSLPDLIWSVGPQLSATLFDGGSLLAQKKSSEHTYKAQVASYKNTVLTAFQEVEDQLIAVRSYQKQVDYLHKVAQNNKRNLYLTENQYKQGIVDYYQVISARITYYNSLKSLSDNKSLEKTSEVSLIKALGGGWQEKDLEEKGEDNKNNPKVKNSNNSKAN